MGVQMALSRKHYKMIARCIKEAEWVIDSRDNETLHRPSLINNLCIELKKDNSLFNKDRFVNACYNEETRADK